MKHGFWTLTTDNCIVIAVEHDIAPMYEEVAFSYLDNAMQDYIIRRIKGGGVEGSIYIINDDEMDSIILSMDFEKIPYVCVDHQPCTNYEFLLAYLDIDPDFDKVLTTEFGINL